ncbi:unnamed protein product [Durusdinium trenchii]|uniref:Uncharacterized protein n=2 Tax=Durusdinium trenchii TaxID=1381693 RepID=A0ABP0S1S2_9DINO
MGAIDICDSEEEDGALARKRAAIRKRRQAAAASAEAVGSTEEPKVEASAPAALSLLELPTGPWECAFCAESNGEKRLKCNNCLKPRPGTEELHISAPKAAPLAPMPANSGRRKRGRGWDDWEEQAQKAAAEASAQNAHLMKDVVNSWKPTVEQLKAMTVAELGPVCKSWKISIEPKDYMRDVMLSKALKVIHGVES